MYKSMTVTTEMKQVSLSVMVETRPLVKGNGFSVRLVTVFTRTTKDLWHNVESGTGGEALYGSFFFLLCV